MGNFVLIGGSYGIGFQLAQQLVEEGNTVHIYARTIGKLVESENLIFHTHNVMEDKLDPSQITNMIDGLVYLPGSIQLKPFHRISKQDFLDDFHINFLGAVDSIQAFLPQLKEAKGSIVLISSIAATTGMPFHTSISAAKGAIEGFAKSLAAELAPNVRVNVVAPSLTDTPLAERFLSSPEKKDASSKRHPLGRVGKAEDIAEAISYLLSPKSSWVSGQVLHIDGGMSSLKTT